MKNIKFHDEYHLYQGYIIEDFKAYQTLKTINLYKF